MHGPPNASSLITHPRRCFQCSISSAREVASGSASPTWPGCLMPSSRCLYSIDRLCGLVVRHSLRDREVRGSIPGRVKPRTLKSALAADPPCVKHLCGFSVKPGRPGVRMM
ncbi:hypothetical protein ElyMa_000291000 [Elysia marginata]|uniref:SOCS box domain-containing protein n=1 Tax=Elysia marginata TaxID=1093978 RepID=A0AAV4F7B8_9GAST|nr:hypothetical protein ElyMa_000291000 [Elysia marginata]